MKKATSGFTIVELLIVIVVIAILAAITVVAFNGVTTRADTISRFSELKAWEKQFKLYYAQEGKFPTMANGGYCLGTGFPNWDGSGLGNCYEVKVPGSTRYQVSPTLNTELQKVATLPSGPRTFVVEGAGSMGPYVNYYSSTYLHISTIIKGSACPSGTITNYTYSGNEAVICAVIVTTDV